jgi:ATP-dependent DNA ligase
VKKINTFAYFFPERPGLIHIDQGLFTSLSMNPAWIAEPKYNGSRLLLHRLPSGNWEFWNRHKERFNYTPSPEVAAALADLPLLEGEYYLFDGELRHNKTVGVRHKIVLYDCLISQGELMTPHPFRWRRHVLEVLAHIMCDDRIISIAPQYPDHFREVFDELTPDPEVEGLVIKRLDGKLNLGRTRAVNSTWMFKVRKPNNSYHF